nr:MAG TPA: Amelogenin [Caudoviricetes sp.]
MLPTPEPFCYGFVPMTGWLPQQNHPMLAE